MGKGDALGRKRGRYPKNTPPPSRERESFFGRGEKRGTVFLNRSKFPSADAINKSLGEEKPARIQRREGKKKENFPRPQSRWGDYPYTKWCQPMFRKKPAKAFGEKREEKKGGSHL